MITDAGVTLKARAMFACEPYLSKSACISGVMGAEFTAVNWVLTEAETAVIEKPLASVVYRGKLSCISNIEVTL